MEVIKNADALGVTQGINQGYAQVLGQSSFDPLVYLQNMNAAAAAAEAKRAKDAMDYKAKWANVKIPTADTVNQYNREALDAAVSTAGEYYQTLFEQGIDPNSPMAKKELAKMETGVKMLADAGKEVATTVARYEQEAKNHDPKIWEEWVNGLNQIKDPIKAAEYVRTNVPFKRTVNTVEILQKLIKPEDIMKIYENTAGVTTKEIDPKIVEEKLDTLLWNNPEYKDELDQAYQDGFGTLWNSVDEFEQNIKGQAIALGRPKSVTREQRGGGSGYGNSAKPYEKVYDITPAGIRPNAQFRNEEDVTIKGGELKKGLKSLVTSESPSDWKLLSQTDVIGSTKDSDVNTSFVLNYKDNTQIKEGNFVNVDGQVVTGKITGFKISQDGSVWGVLGSELIPIVPSTRITSGKFRGLADANANQLTSSIGAQNFEEIKQQIFSLKRGGATETVTTTTVAAGDNIFKEE